MYVRVCVYVRACVRGVCTCVLSIYIMCVCRCIDAWVRAFVAVCVCETANACQS